MENSIKYKHLLSEKFKILEIFSNKINLNQLKRLIFKREFFKYKEMDLIIKNFNTQYIYKSGDFIEKNSLIVYIRIVKSTTPLLSIETINFYKKNANKLSLNARLNLNRDISKCNVATIFNPPKGLPKSLWLISGSEKEIKTQAELDCKKYTNRELFIDETTEKKISPKLIPKHLTCPFCQDIIKEAVLLPCCGFFNCCNSCILYLMYNNYKINCIYKNCNFMKSFQYITPNFVIRKEVEKIINGNVK
jgi:hypothetical protein